MVPRSTDQQTELVFKAAESLAAMERGTLVTHVVLREMLAAQDLSLGRYHSVCGRLRRHLLAAYQIFTSVVNGRGYVLLPDNEAHTVPRARMLKAVKQVGRAVREYNEIPVAKLASAERDRLIEESQRAGNLFGLASRALKG